MTIPVLLDTDIATDPDDLLALLTIAASPELELVAVTATYGDTHLRAQIVRQSLRWIGLDVPIGAGADTTLSNAPIWYAGNEPRQLDSSLVDRGFEPLAAAQLIVDSARAQPGTLVIVAIGPLTNLATALELEPDLPALVAGVSVMGGDFGDDTQAEHNFRCDAVAADAVARSGLRLRSIGVEQTRLLPLEHQHRTDMFDAPESALSARVHDDLEWWMRFTGTNEILVHDPLAVMMVTHPELFEFTPSSITVDTTTEGAGRLHHTPGSDIEYVTAMRTNELRSIIVERIKTSLHAAR